MPASFLFLYLIQLALLVPPNVAFSPISYRMIVKLLMMGRTPGSPQINQHLQLVWVLSGIIHPLHQRREDAGDLVQTGQGVQQKLAGVGRHCYHISEWDGRVSISSPQLLKPGHRVRGTYGATVLGAVCGPFPRSGIHPGCILGNERWSVSNESRFTNPQAMGSEAYPTLPSLWWPPSNVAASSTTLSHSMCPPSIITCWGLTYPQYGEGSSWHWCHAMC